MVLSIRLVVGGAHLSQLLDVTGRRAEFYRFRHEVIMEMKIIFICGTFRP
jgi:hypothetical protein